MAQTTLSSLEIIELLHPVFDTQIINYGAYNLVLATGSAIYRNSDIAAMQQDDQQYFLIGYREQPLEVVVTPINIYAMSEAGSPTAIDNTNAIRAYALNENSFGLESTTGSSFILTLRSEISIHSEYGDGVLEQDRDVQDFQQFLLSSWLDETE